jgi:pimeloyl-ACP methyl ester carboxylesterase
MSETRQPTVVLVHGAFADGSSWNGVIEPLQAKGVQVIAPANPLRGTSIDSEYTAALFDETPGAVLAVGHSYGGAVITNAATKAIRPRRLRRRRGSSSAASIATSETRCISPSLR